MVCIDVPLRRIAIDAFFGNRKFWEVIDAVAHERSVANRSFTTDEQWRRIFVVAETCALPKFVWLGLLRQRRIIEEAEALGRSAEDRHGDELAEIRTERELAQRKPMRLLKTRSSRGRTRVAAAEREEATDE